MFRHNILFSILSQRVDFNSCEPSYSGTILTGPNQCTAITVKPECTEVDEEAFVDSNIESIDFTNALQLKKIGFRSFHNCDKIRVLTLPSNLEELGSNSFSNCTSLEKVTIPTTIKFIGIGAFAYCSSLKSITLPTSLSTIPTCMFAGCSNLTKVTIPENYHTLAPGCFEECTYLQKVVLPSNLYMIGERAFYKTCIRKLSIPDTVEFIGQYAFSFNVALTYLKLSNRVTDISYYIASNCPKFNTVILPEKIKNIGKNSFESCDIRSIDIPNSVTELGYNAFSQNSNLQTLKLPRKLPHFDTGVFYST